MPIQIGAEKDSLANKYAADAPYGTVFTAAPLTTGAATNEMNGGSPAFARKALGWTTSSGGAGSVSGSATFDIGSGKTATHIGVCASVTLGTADVKDWADVPDQTFSSQGQLVSTFVFTQT
jgi:hypothetical protein